MSEPRDTCRPVVLPSGQTVVIRSEVEPTGESLAAVKDIMAAALRLAQERSRPDPGAEALWSRVAAARGDRTLRECAHEAGVKFSVLFRVGQGRMPPTEDLARIEAWLAAGASEAPCQCCVFGNHTEPCSCDGSACCHPQIHREDAGAASRWCAVESFPAQQVEADGSVTPTEISGHVVCRGERRHDAGHRECCMGAAELESWDCGCRCHGEGDGDGLG